MYIDYFTIVRLIAYSKLCLVFLCFLRVQTSTTTAMTTTRVMIPTATPAEIDEAITTTLLDVEGGVGEGEGKGELEGEGRGDGMVLQFSKEILSSGFAG